MSRINRKLELAEVIGSVASGRPEQLIGYEVVSMTNTVAYVTGQRISIAEASDLIEHKHYQTVCKSRKYGDKI